MRALQLTLSLLLLTSFGVLSLAAAPSWVASEKRGNRGYFLHALNPRIEIYNFETQSWEDPITLSRTPSTLKVDDSHLYIAYGKALYRYNRDGSEETHIANIANNVKGIELDGNVIFVDHSTPRIRVESFHKTSFAKIDSFQTDNYSWDHPFEIDSESNRLLASGGYYGMSTIDYTASGGLAGGHQYQRLQEHPDNRIYQWPSGNRLITRSGWVYKSNNKTQIERLEPNIDQIDYIEEKIPIISVANDVYSYSIAYEQTGQKALNIEPEALYAHYTTETVFAFAPDDQSDNGISVEAISFEELSVGDPNATIDPSTLSFTPDDIIIDGNGIVYLSHRTFELLFRWHSATQDWLENLPLKASPNTIAFGPNKNRIYLGYDSGDITYFDTTSNNPTETLLKNANEPVGLIVETGDFLFVDQYNSNSQTYHVYNSTGNVLSSQSHGRREQIAVWNDSTRRIVYTDQGSYNQVHSGGVDSSGKLSDYTFSHTGLSGNQAPLYSHPSEGLVLTSNGHLLKSDVQESVTTLPEPIVGAAWVEGKLHTAQENSVKSWNLPTYEEDATSITFDNEAIGFVGTPDGYLLLITHTNTEQIRINKLGTDYNTIAPEELATPSLNVEKVVGTSAKLEWSYVSGASTYTIERQTVDAGNWETVVVLSDSETTSYVVKELALNSEYSFRVVAENGNLMSDYSNTSIADTKTPVNTLTPLELDAIDGDLNWADIDESGVLYLNFWSTAAIFRYDLVTQKWLESIPLRKALSSIHLSKTRNAILAGYDDGQVSFISLSSTIYSEIPFVKLTDNINFISSNSNYIIVGEYNNQYVLDEVGDLYDSANILYSDTMEPFLWDDISQRFYWQDSYVNAAEINEDHQLVKVGQVSEEYFYGNLVAEDFTSSLLLSSDGSISSVNTGGVLLHLNESVSTGAWVGGNLFTASGDKIRKWNETTYAREDIKVMSTYVRKLLRGPNSSVVAITHYERPRVEILKTDLTVLPPVSLATPIQPVISEPTANQITINWLDVGGENAYVLERRTNEGAWEQLANLPANQTHYRDNTANDEASYEYRLKAINGDLESTYSDVLSISNNEPTAPQNLSARVTELNQVELSWDAAENTYGYSIERSPDGTYWYRVGTGGDSQLQWTDNNSHYQGELYFYRVEALGSFGKKAVSETIAAGIDYGLPASPNIGANPNGLDSVRLSLNRPHNSERVRIERSMEVNPFEWIELTTLEANEFQFIDTGLSHSTRYYYRAIAINANGETVQPQPSEATTHTLYPPPPPQIYVGQDEEDHVRIFCATNSSAETLYVYRRAFLESEPQLLFQSDDKRIFIDETVDLDQGYTYFAMTENEAGSSPQSSPVQILVEAKQTLFEEDFEGDFSQDRFYAFDGTIESNESNAFVNITGYSATIMPKEVLKNGGTVALSIKYSGSIEHDGIVRVSIANPDTPPIYLSTISSFNLIEPNDWHRFYFNIPDSIINDDTRLVIYLIGYNSTGNPAWALDDLLVTQTLIQSPPKPKAVVAKQTGDGDTAVFWLPSLEAVTYTVESSADDGDTWSEAAQVQSPTCFFHDAGNSETPIQYRVSASNKGGSSEPSYSEKVESDYDLTLAVESGVKKVLNSPDSYSLHTTEEMEIARIDGQQDVVKTPNRFGLFTEEKISSVYYELKNEWVQIKGDILEATWSLYQSTDLSDWTKSTAEVKFKLEPETEANFIKIGPDLDSLPNEPASD